MNTLHEFLLAIDKGDAAGFAALFTVDPEPGTCEVVKFKRIARGPTELMDLCLGIHANFKGCLHFEHTPVLKGCPTGVSHRLLSESYWSAVREGQIISTGIHKDVLEDRGDGRWLIRERKVFHHWTMAGGNERPEGEGAWDGVS